MATGSADTASLREPRRAFQWHHPVTLQRRPRMQAVILPSIDIDHHHVPLDRRNRRQEAFTVETLGIQLLRRLVGGADDDHAFIEHHLEHLEQPPENDRIADVIDEQFVETQHPHLGRQLTGQRPQRIGDPAQLKGTLVYPAHEVMEMLTP